MIRTDTAVPPFEFYTQSLPSSVSLAGPQDGDSDAVDTITANIAEIGLETVGLMLARQTTSNHSIISGLRPALVSVENKGVVVDHYGTGSGVIC